MQIPIEKCTVDKTARRQLIIIQKMEEKTKPSNLYPTSHCVGERPQRPRFTGFWALLSQSCETRIKCDRNQIILEKNHNNSSPFLSNDQRNNNRDFLVCCLFWTRNVHTQFPAFLLPCRPVGELMSHSQIYLRLAAVRQTHKPQVLSARKKNVFEIHSLLFTKGELVVLLLVRQQKKVFCV